jgi:uncharacterized lipoprotein YddW (UPF0748 family)
VLEHPDRIPALIDTARGLAATDLFVQAYRGGRAWYDADLADASPYRETRQKHGVDALRQLVEQAHAHGLRVHAWVNVLSLSGNPDAPIVRALGRKAVHVDRRGRSLLDYPQGELPAPDRHWYRMGTPGVYLDPGAPGVRERLVRTFAELLSRYPELDGLHLDYIRYPGVLPFSPGTRFGVGLDFGYGAATRERFRSETGLAAPFRDSLANAVRWDDWRRDQVTGLVAAIGTAARQARPGVLLSAAVWADPDRGYETLGQDWRRWLEDGLLDLAVPMAYTLDDRLLRYRATCFAREPGAEHIWVGLGSWLFSGSPERALAQVALVREAGAAGEALFSYDSIAESPALRDALVAGAQPAPAQTGPEEPAGGR